MSGSAPLGDWDDDDFDIPKAGPAPDADLDDIFDFKESLTLEPDGASAAGKKDLPPLGPGETDLSSDRGVIMKRHNAPSESAKPSEDEPFVEMHYEGFRVADDYMFDTSRAQNYAMVVQLDIPPSGKSTVIRGLEIVLRELAAGDRVSVRIESRYAYGKEGTKEIDPDTDLRFEIEVLDVRATPKKVEKVDTTKTDMNRLEEIRREREIAQQRREEEAAARDAEREKKANRVAALREKLANKNKGKKGGKKKK